MEQDNNIRTPYNIEAEEALLGSIFIKPDVLSEIIEILTADDFYKNNYKVIFNEMKEIYRTSAVVDSLIIINSLKKKGVLEDVGGEQLIYDLTEAVPTAANAKTYAQIIRDNAIQRRLIDTGSKIVEMAYKGYDDIQTMLDKSESMIFKIAEFKQKKDVITLKELANMELERMEKMPKGSGITGISTGYIDFDSMTSGFHGSDLLILAARPAMGKTAFALNLALNIARQNKAVLVFSLEMSNAQLYQRLLAIETRLPLTKIREAKLSENEWATLANGVGRLADLPFYISDAPGINVLEIKAIARRLRAEGKLDAIVIDYLQLITGTDSGRKSREQEISEISRSLKIIAKELDIPVLTLSQLSRAPELRADKRPMLSDLRESGAIEQDADIVLFLYRDEYYQDHRGDSDNNTQASSEPTVVNNIPVTEVIIGKQRNGPVGTVKIGFIKEQQRFVNITFRTD